MLLKTTSLIATTLLALSACSAPSRGDDGGGNGDDGSGSGSGSGGDDCSAASKLIYAVDNTNNLLQFDGETHMFSNLGALDCPVQYPPEDDGFGGQAGEEPFSMAVDRDANIYVLFHDGDLLSDSFGFSEVMKVDSQTLHCTATSWTTQDDEEAFGMGFSTDTDGGSTDTLFIAGTTDDGDTEPTEVSLASVDVTSMRATVKGNIEGQPELTGTGDAKLWGYFPNTGVIQEINKGIGGVVGQQIKDTAIAGSPIAWAFAFYGGDFYVFLAKKNEKTTTVHQVGPNGTDKGTFAAPTNSLIVGAGVSTCAPLIIGKSTN